MAPIKKGPGKGLLKGLLKRKPKRITALKLPTGKSGVPHAKGVQQDLSDFPAASPIAITGSNSIVKSRKGKQASAIPGIGLPGDFGPAAINQAQFERSLEKLNKKAK